jgi:hypothetical protein
VVEGVEQLLFQPTLPRTSIGLAVRHNGPCVETTLFGLRQR